MNKFVSINVVKDLFYLGVNKLSHVEEKITFQMQVVFGSHICLIWYFTSMDWLTELMSCWDNNSDPGQVSQKQNNKSSSIMDTLNI